MSTLALCVESSHSRGMGHLFRALSIASALGDKGLAPLLLLNDDPRSIAHLAGRGVPFECVPLHDDVSDWESRLILEKGISLWMDDRLGTSLSHGHNVKKNRIPLVCLDDPGEGAAESDLNFATLPCFYDAPLAGRRVLRGQRYLILPPSLSGKRRARTRCERRLVTLGGSDTHGATLAVLALLQKHRIPADILCGPGFLHADALARMRDAAHPVLGPVDDLSRILPDYDLAITGGGMTPFEACATGLPCIIIANEPHEVLNARFLDGLGCARFGGAHEAIDESSLTLPLDIRGMSARGLETLTTDGVENILLEALRLI